MGVNVTQDVTDIVFDLAEAIGATNTGVGQDLYALDVDDDFIAFLAWNETTPGLTAGTAIVITDSVSNFASATTLATFMTGADASAYYAVRIPLASCERYVRITGSATVGGGAGTICAGFIVRRKTRTALAAQVAAGGT